MRNHQVEPSANLEAKLLVKGDGGHRAFEDDWYTLFGRFCKHCPKDSPGRPSPAPCWVCTNESYIWKEMESAKSLHAIRPSVHGLKAGFQIE